MPRLSMLPTLCREVLSAPSFPREPEPDLVMDGEEAVAAYAAAGRADGVMAAAYLFHSAHISQVLQGCRSVLDLGCGPATQLAQVAALNPDIAFTGIDLSEPMLDQARAHIAAQGLANVAFASGNITRLDGVPDASADGVISTVTLHHLPTEEDLRACFRAIHRVLRPGGALYLTDFTRLKSLRSVLYFAYMDRARAPHLFSLDYERSLRAAFTRAGFARLAREALPGRGALVSTFAVPLLVILKSPDRPLPERLGARLRDMRAALPRRDRRTLDDLRLFFRLGGLRNDPFAPPRRAARPPQPADRTADA